MTSNGNNSELTALFNLICTLSNESQDAQFKLKTSAEQIVRLMKVSLKSQLDQDRVGKPFTMPYKDLTDLVFNHRGEFPTSDTLSSFRGLIVEKILTDEYCTAGSATEDQKQEKKNHFMSCYDKVINHLQLAQIQRDYIQNTTKEAEQLAKTAKETADTAKKSAKKAKKTYDTMFANYVTILGVFTAIIVTIFGGLNVLGSVVLSKNADFATISSLAALALFCMISLLYFLTHMILRIAHKDGERKIFGRDKLTCAFAAIAIICIVVICVGSEMAALPW